MLYLGPFTSAPIPSRCTQPPLARMYTADLYTIPYKDNSITFISDRIWFVIFGLLVNPSRVQLHPHHIIALGVKAARQVFGLKEPIKDDLNISTNWVWTQFSSFGKLRALFSTSNSRNWRHDSFVGRICLTLHLSEIWLGAFWRKTHFNHV